MEDILDTYQDMVPSNIKFIYKGGISFDIIDSFVSIILKRLDEIEKDINIKKRVFSVLLECSQNLCIHKEEDERHSSKYDTASVYFSIEKIDGAYKITTGNFIKNAKIDKLKGILDEVNSHQSPESLKGLYNTILTNKNFSDKGGGGLGLIDIARKSSSKLLYSFFPIDGTFSFYSLSVNVK